jgi:phage terminase small subunit
MKERKLTPKQDAFVLAYLETGNASEAYRRAYDTSSKRDATINNSAYELLRHPEIARRIADQREATTNAATINRAGVLALITEIATADASQLAEVQVRCCRHCWGVLHAYQWKNAAEFGYKLAESLDLTARDRRQWEKDVALGAKRPEPEPHPLPTDEGGYGFDVYASPNPECPRCLGEGHVMPVIKDTRKLKGAAKRLYAGFKQTKDGIEIKTRDQAQALALLAKEFKIAQDVAPTVNVGVGVNAQGAQNVTVVSVDPQEASRQYQELMKGG